MIKSKLFTEFWYKYVVGQYNVELITVLLGKLFRGASYPVNPHLSCIRASALFMTDRSNRVIRDTSVVILQNHARCRGITSADPKFEYPGWLKKRREASAGSYHGWQARMYPGSGPSGGDKNPTSCLSELILMSGRLQGGSQRDTISLGFWCESNIVSSIEIPLSPYMGGYVWGSESVRFKLFR